SRSPANYPLEVLGSPEGILISVGAHDENNLVADFSGGGTADWSQVVNLVPSLVAPGVGIVSARPGTAAGQYLIESGSSMAAPHVAGLLALILDLLRKRAPDAKPRDAANLLLDSIVPLSPN